jgi:hypothetical protein
VAVDTVHRRHFSSHPIPNRSPIKSGKGAIYSPGRYVFTACFFTSSG